MCYFGNQNRVSVGTFKSEENDASPGKSADLAKGEADRQRGEKTTHWPRKYGRTLAGWPRKM